ncbi:Molybdenum cofactor sulfurase 3 [Hordeum vulgare]|nr:Molybdenum cofactor sulfurase 3 [Hordeum vulgare]
MVLAQQNGWHVMLDADALGPKDMDSLGLSLFRPDFIITSFYRVFGSDPTGFGCLLIKKSVIGSLQGRNGCNASRMVRIIPVFPQYVSDSIDEFDAVETKGLEDDSCTPIDENVVPDVRNGSQLPAFLVSQDVDCIREDPEEEIYENGRGNHFRQVSEIQEEPEVEEVA